MTSVNLIPPELRLNHARRRRLRSWLIVIAAAVVVMLVGSGVKYCAFLKAARTLRLVEGDCLTIQQQMSQCDSAEDLLRRWQGRLALQQQLNAYPCVVVLTNFLVHNTPELVYLNTLEFTPRRVSASRPAGGLLPKAAAMFATNTPAGANFPDAPASSSDTAAASQGCFSLMCQGRALNYQLVADFLDALRGAGLFSDVQLRETSRNASLPECVDFEIECTVIAGRSGPGVEYASLQKAANF